MNQLTLSPEDAVDLQVHTIYSDGHWQPESLFAYLRDEGFRLVAITDHDSCEHAVELQLLGASYGVALIPATEMTTDWRGTSAHLLCYAPNGFGETLPALARQTVERQRDNTRDVYRELLRRGYQFSHAASALGGLNAPERPSDNETLLRAHGYAPDMPSAFALIVDAGYRQMTAPLADTVSAAHEAGALTVIAHPGRGDGEIHRYELDELAALMDEIQLDGIEVYYPKHSGEQVVEFEAFAARRGLLVSAGSDSHGPDHRLPIPYPASLVTGLLARCGIEVQPQRKRANYS